VAAQLKDAFGPDVPMRIAAMVGAVHPAFPEADFLRDALDGYEALELTPRARLIAASLGRHLPADYERAAAILVASLGPPLPDPDEAPQGMAPFLYMPHVYLVADRGLDHFDISMAAQHAITQRFTCEFSIRAFIERMPERTFTVLAQWTRDPSLHVRRLVSEGTRPRLPWAPRLRALVADPAPVLPLLEALRDDPASYVRRSVANNLNDIAKDHPALVTAIAARWLGDATPERRRVVRHALRTLVKAGDPAALEVLGIAGADAFAARDLRVEPSPARIGGAIAVSARLANTGTAPARALVHLRVHFVKARGGTSPRTFVAGDLTLAPGEEAAVGKRISLRQHTTRTHYPGDHRVELVVNGWALMGVVVPLLAGGG
jgi:3-methyladenine DNA glycosylase AlkC